MRVRGWVSGIGLLGLGLACTGVPLDVWSGGADNVRACREYRALYNALPCVREELPLDFCPEALEVMSCDVDAYYACLRDELRCNGRLLDVGGQLSCTLVCP
jgi:hypothetical protein